MNNNEAGQQLPPSQNHVMPNQNRPDPFIIHQAVIDMFPELDLTQTINRIGHMVPSPVLVDYIVENMDKIPKKQKQKVEESIPYSPDRIGDLTMGDENDGSELLIDKLLVELLHTIEVEMRKDRGNVKRRVPMKRFLANQFPQVRMEFINTMLVHFQYAMLPTAIACFLSENGFGNKIQKVIPNLDAGHLSRMATPIMVKRIHRPEDFPPAMHAEFNDYIDLLRKHQQGTYSSLLTLELQLTANFDKIKCERKELEHAVECLVCFERFAMDRIVYCDAPILSQEDHAVALAHKTQIGSSRMFERKPQVVEKHAFCRGCIRGQAQAATEEILLAEGGLGLCCMVPNCKNPILYAEIRPLLKREIRKKLDERILEENIGMASIINLERCKRCNFAIVMDVDKTINKVFECLRCGTKFCRLCDREWDDEHFGITCEELDVKTQKDRKARELEKQLNEAVIRKCPRCHIAFIKEIGCNKMTCRCGMTQCYLCRESGIDYRHFCEHVRDPNHPDRKCTQCSKPCLLFVDAKKEDERLLHEIQLNAERAEQAEAAGGNKTPGPSTTNNNGGNNGQYNNRMVPRPLLKPHRH